MFEGGLSSRGKIAKDRYFGNVVIVLDGNFFDASGSVVLDKKSLKNACSAGNLWPRIEVSIKGAKSEKVLVLNPFVAARQGLLFCLSLELTSLVTMVFTLLSVLACSMTSDINLAQNLCSTEIKLISSMNESSKELDSIFLPKGIGARMGRMQKTMSSSANSHSVSLTIFCFKCNLGEKFNWDLGMLLNGKARANLITVDLREGWGTFLVENVTNVPLEFAISIFHGGGFENHANIPFTGDIDEGCN
jgi:hypothetical protein